jgi:hypothetical protein
MSDEAIGVGIGVNVAVGNGVNVGVCESVGVGNGVNVGVGESVGVGNGVNVGVGESVGVGNGGATKPIILENPPPTLMIYTSLFRISVAAYAGTPPTLRVYVTLGPFVSMTVMVPSLLLATKT